MFYCLLLNKFVYIFKCGEISEIDSMDFLSRKKYSSFSCILTLSNERQQDKEISNVIRISAFRPR